MAKSTSKDYIYHDQDGLDERGNEFKHESPLQEGEEVGFFYLKNTNIFLSLPSPSHKKELRFGKLIDVRLNRKEKGEYDIFSHKKDTKSDNNNSFASRAQTSMKKTKDSKIEPIFNISKDSIMHDDSSLLEKKTVDVKCSRCNLILDLNSSATEIDGSKDFALHYDKRPFFDGTMNDICRQGGTCNSCNCDQKENRSDAALMVGVAMHCLASNNARIESFQIIILQCNDVIDENGNDGVTKKNDKDEHNLATCENNENKQKVCEQIFGFQVAILMTFSLPHLERYVHSKDHEKISIKKNKSHRSSTGDVKIANFNTIELSRKRKRGLSLDGCISNKSNDKCSNKLLDPALQLFFSLLRSDWKYLDLEIEVLFSNYYQEYTSTKLLKQQQFHSSQRSLFPKKCSLGELYGRIQGISNHENFVSYPPNSNKYNIDSNISTTLSLDHIPVKIATFIEIPADVLKYQIAGYLRARSLYSLRCTCKCMYTSLISIVPGMKLRLFQHQVKSLEWMQKREIRDKTEVEVMFSGFHAEDVGNKLDGGDLYKAVSAGAIASLTTRNPKKNQRSRHIWLVDTYTGAILSQLNHKAKDKNVDECSDISFYNDDRNAKVDKLTYTTKTIARGGLLCDDPGLGKTITVLSLILQTLGQSSRGNETTAKFENSKLKNIDSLIFNAYWKEVPSSVREESLSCLWRKLPSLDSGSIFFKDPVDSNLDGCHGYYKIIKKPICFTEIRENILKGIYNDDFNIFCEDLDLCFRNAKKFNDLSSPVFKAAERLSDKVKLLITEFVTKEVNSAQKYYSKYSNISSECNTLLRKKKKDKLCPSSGTLLVIPNILLKHWEEQIMSNIDFTYCTNKIPLIYKHGPKKKCTKSRISCKSQPYETDDLYTADDLCNVQCSHCPLIFIDCSGLSLPPPEFLSKFYIVITTSQRLTNEWKNGSVRNKTRLSTQDNHHQSPCNLLKVFWLRLIVDEGHSMGNGTTSNLILFASWITSQRRWAMTGTPTPQTSSNNGLGNILGLMKFLKHDYLCTNQGGQQQWKQLCSGYVHRHLAPFFRIQSLLKLLMIRHTKSEIEELSKPHFNRTFTDMSYKETLAYNTLLTAIQINIVTTSMEGKTSGMEDSLLNPQNSKHAHQALSNIRLACSGGTSVCPTLTKKNWDETIYFMKNIHKVNNVKLKMVENFLHRMTTEQLSSCMSCGIQLQTLFLVPCACIICTECVAKNEDASCPNCKHTFDIDDFQMLQPGLQYSWKWNIEETRKKREATANFRQQILNGATTAETANVQQLALQNISNQNGNIIQQSNMPRSRVHQCVFPSKFSDGKCLICRKIHEKCNFLNEDLICSICRCVAEDPPKEESKASYIIQKILQLQTLKAKDKIDCFLKGHRRPLKIIVFSQFRQILNVVGDRLIRKFGSACVAEFWGKTRQHELETFEEAPDCFCMLLGKDGSHGLDLSFVTNIFFLDEIIDKAMESQVVSRAYRMGASGHVAVEQLVSRHSVEELIIEMNERNSNSLEHFYEDSNTSQGKQPLHCFPTIQKRCIVTKGENDGARTTIDYLLSNASLIRWKSKEVKHRKNVSCISNPSKLTNHVCFQ